MTRMAGGMRALVILAVFAWAPPARAQAVPSKCNAAKLKATGAGEVMGPTPSAAAKFKAAGA